MHGGLPFVGRETALAVALRALTGREHRGVVLIGPPGVGKSRLAAEVCDRLGQTVVRCYATSATSRIPFGALAAALPADLPARTGNPVRHAAELLLSRVNGRLVLAVDDAHLLDDTSIAVLQHLIRHDEASLLLTARPATGSDWLAGLWKANLIVRLPVDDLSRTEVEDLLARALGGQPNSELRRRIWTRSAGNPLYVRELIAAGAGHGPVEMTGRLAEAVEDNLGRLREPARRVMELVAYGEPIELDMLAKLTDPDVVDELEALGLLRISATGRRAHVRLGHPLYGELLRATCSTLRARAHRQALADAVESAGARRREDLMRLALWRLDAGVPAPVELLTTAAEHAWAIRDVRLAERLGRAAIAAGGGARAGSLLADVLHYREAPDHAEEVLAAIVARTSSRFELTWLGVGRAMNAFFGLADRERALALLSEADRPGLPPVLSQSIRLVRLDFDLASQPVDDLSKILSEVDSADDTGRSAAVAAYLCAINQNQAGQYTRSLATIAANERRVTALRHMDRWLPANTECVRCENLALSGDLAGAEALAEQMHEDAFDESGRFFAHPLWCAMLSRCARLRGRTETARRWALDGAGTTRTWPLTNDATVLSELAMAEALCGRPTRAADALAQAESVRRPAWRVKGFPVDLARPWVLASAGQVPEAAAAAAHAAKAMRGHGLHGFEVIALHDAARFGALTSTRLAELAEQLDDPMTQAYALHARGREHRDPSALEDAATRFSRMGATLFAAEALAETVRLATGRQATAAARRQAALMAEFDEVSTPVLRTADEFTGLTPRQLEVARLAVAGLTNQEIADRLHTSKRTIDNHLHAGYLALGIAGRPELRTALGAGMADPQPDSVNPA